jgi:predicted N-acetyltransferase YhbS
MEFTTYDEGDLPKLAELVQKAFPLHEISIKSLRRITLEDPNFLPNDLIVAQEDGQFAGAVLGARYRRMPEERTGARSGYLKVICTSPFDESLMNDLCGKMEDRLRDEGAGRLEYSAFASWHLLPGVDLRYENLLDFLNGRGFKKTGECVDYVIDLHAFRTPRRVAKLEKEILDGNTTIRLAEPGEKERIREFVAGKSGFNWSFEAARAIGPKGSGVWIAEDAGEIIAFSVFGSLEHHWFGPIGVDEARRKRGLGSVLLFRTLESMKDLGIPRAIVPWTGHLFFYSQVPGVVGLRHYWMMGKDL